MGCDVHMVVQVRRENGWETVKFPNKWFGKYDNEPEFSLSAYSDRNYDVFAMLGNVRNGRGFAGCDTGDGFDFISDCRGYPEDFEIDSGESDYHQGFWMGDHSHTWISLEELNAFDFSKTTVHRGVISLSERKRMLKFADRSPESWCGGVSGGGTRMVRLEVMDDMIQRGEDDGDGLLSATVFAAIGWEETYATSAGRFYSEFFPSLQKLGYPKDVRLVMGFDS